MEEQLPRNNSGTSQLILAWTEITNGELVEDFKYVRWWEMQQRLKKYYLAMQTSVQIFQPIKGLFGQLPP